MRLHLLAALLLLPALISPAAAQTARTSCNIRFNNRGIVAGDVDCTATFRAGRLERVKFLFSNGKWYDWSTFASQVTPDPRWPECVRYTQQDGNQWQACTVPSPSQLFQGAQR